MKRYLAYLAVVVCFVVLAPQAFAKPCGTQPGKHLGHAESTFPDGH